jgi:hypothetical protein
MRPPSGKTRIRAYRWLRCEMAETKSPPFLHKAQQGWATRPPGQYKRDTSGTAPMGHPRGTSRHKSTVRRLTRGGLASRITKREILGEIARNRMPPEPNTPSAIEQAVSRALRDNLERIQRTSDELHQAVADVVAACGSTKPVNALAPMLRAQTSAAALSATLDVL